VNEVQSPQISHICFDLDGVLIDSIDVMRLAWQAATSKMKIEIPFFKYQKGLGQPFNEVLKMLSIPESMWSDLSKEYERVSEINCDLIQLFPRTIEVLTMLKSQGFSVSIVTSKPRARAEFIVDKLLSNLGDCLVAGDDSGLRGKPNPDPLLFAAISVGAEPATSLYVGDMTVDCQAAQRAGFRYVHASWGYGAEIEGDRDSITTLGALGSWLGGLDFEE